MDAGSRLGLCRQYLFTPVVKCFHYVKLDRLKIIVVQNAMTDGNYKCV
jgi:hypothetical protein